VTSKSEKPGRLEGFFESTLYSWFVIILVIVNSVTLYLETGHGTNFEFLRTLDNIILIIFVVEAVVKITVYKAQFFRSGWNLFDVLVILGSVVGDDAIKTLRILRVGQLLLAFDKTPIAFRRVAHSMVNGVRSVLWAASVIFVIFLVYGLIGTRLYGVEHPDLFGNMGGALFTLFQCMTLESWSTGVARIVMKTEPLSWMYFVSFILVTALTSLNAIVGIYVDSFSNFTDQAEKADQSDQSVTLKDELHRLHTKLEKIEKLMERNGSGSGSGSGSKVS